MESELIYHLCDGTSFRRDREAGDYTGSADARLDGFLHFSTGSQVVESAAIHAAGREGLVLLAVRTASLGDRLRWEESRGGQLFPHVFEGLPLAAVVEVHDLPVDADGRHVFPDGFGANER